jgi:hypothetical protein
LRLLEQGVNVRAVLREAVCGHLKLLDQTLKLR